MTTPQSERQSLSLREGVGNPSSKRPNGLVLTRRDITTPKRNSGWERHGDGSVGCSTELGTRTERNSVALCQRSHGHIDGPRGARGGTA
jgi:hypothetical protein